MDKVLNPSLMSLGPFEEHLIFQMLDINSLPQGTWIKSFLYYNQQRAGDRPPKRRLCLPTEYLTKSLCPEYIRNLKTPIESE